MSSPRPETDERQDPALRYEGTLSVTIQFEGEPRNEAARLTLEIEDSEVVAVKEILSTPEPEELLFLLLKAKSDLRQLQKEIRALDEAVTAAAAASGARRVDNHLKELLEDADLIE